MDKSKIKNIIEIVPTSVRLHISTADLGFVKLDINSSGEITHGQSTMDILFPDIDAETWQDLLTCSDKDLEAIIDTLKALRDKYNEALTILKVKKS